MIGRHLRSLMIAFALAAFVAGALAVTLRADDAYLGTWKIDTEWQSTIAFIVLFLVLLLKPRGLFGRGLR